MFRIYKKKKSLSKIAVSKKYSKENKWSHCFRRVQYLIASALGAIAGFGLIIFIIAFIKANIHR